MPYINCVNCGYNYHDSKATCPLCGEDNDWYKSEDDYIQDDYLEDYIDE